MLSEAAFHLRSASLALQFLLDGLVKLDFDASAHLGRLAQLAAAYADRQPDIADLCLIRMSELRRECPVITTDVTDFRVYRRGRRETIPLIHPPGRRK